MSDLNQKIRAVVRTCTGLAADKVRPANQSGPVGEGLFATVFIPNSVALGVVEVKWAAVPQSDDLTETATGQNLIMASVQFFRAGAIDAATKLRSRIQMSAALEAMQTHGLGCGKMSQVRDLSSVVNEVWEERAQIDIFFHHVGVEVAVVATFGTFPITTTTGFDYVNTTEVFEP